MCLADLFYRCSRSNHGREKSHSGEIRQETGEQRGAVCYQCRYHQHLSCLLTDIGNGRSDQPENNQWNDETQKFAEDSVESHKYSDQFAGKNVSIPNVMAMIIRANKPIFNLFMIMCYYSNCKDRIIEQITYQIVKYKKNNLWKRQI